MNTKEAIGAVIREKRQAKDWTQEALSAEAGISSRFLQKIEAGHRLPSLITLFKLSQALGVGPDKLIVPVWKDWQKQ